MREFSSRETATQSLISAASLSFYFVAQSSTPLSVLGSSSLKAEDVSSVLSI